MSNIALSIWGIAYFVAALLATSLPHEIGPSMLFSIPVGAIVLMVLYFIGRVSKPRTDLVVGILGLPGLVAMSIVAFSLDEFVRDYRIKNRELKIKTESIVSELRLEPTVGPKGGMIGVEVHMAIQAPSDLALTVGDYSDIDTPEVNFYPVPYGYYAARDGEGTVRPVLGNFEFSRLQVDGLEVAGNYDKFRINEGEKKFFKFFFISRLIFNDHLMDIEHTPLNACIHDEDDLYKNVLKYYKNSNEKLELAAVFKEKTFATPKLIVKDRVSFKEVYSGVIREGYALCSSRREK